LETLFFLIIIGVLSAIFSKGKTRTGKSGNKSFLPDNIKEIRTLFNKQFNNFSTEITGPVIVKQEESDSLEKKYLGVKKNFEVSAIELNMQQDVQPLQVKKMTAKVKEIEQEVGSVFSENVDAKTLINGIVWAEILGEPRSKKPYFARKG
jgi:hypothetical protein